ncbi:glycoside hydrolase family 3 C-terminal domain-containing protein [Odoribacter sp. OttesenSCG-928-L07]|nr:glycoside hydrolase family 3 C-terminal domain-containing protein [Odoribacter sp. OttesenSCG-928-L07]MDL2238613.1 glycoside hydrolase family 3 C-terminal domain-containing protein [Bacteroidales bacterium OttesenSCG-928-L14]MDL2240509.1 glycoside hydrolase family 3 C-terminal domain-containing protein [Bacteroidales bacterium OttesenSCG-928-K22]
MSSKLFSLMLCLSFSISALYSQSYKNASLSADERTRDLLSLMTLEEKVGQLLCAPAWEMYVKNGNSVIHSKEFEKQINEYYAGMFWAVFRADPWTKKTLQNGLNPKLAAETANALQKYAIENSRLGIPIFIAEEAPHGHMAIGTTVFPTGIGQASTWNPQLLEQMGSIIAKEIRLQGGHISYGPVIDLSRDPRWSRVEESYGEDQLLTANLAAAIVKGAGAGRVESQFSTIVTVKHFAAYGIPEGGHNGNVSMIGLRELHENFLPPFKAVIDAGALSIMTAYNSIDGVPCTSNKYLLTDVLREEWKFYGFTVSDLGSIEGLYSSHFTANNVQDAAIQSIQAGVNVDLGGNAFKSLIDAVKEKKIEESVIDSAVYKVLRLKFEMNLFENPYVDSDLAEEIVRSNEHIDLARKIAQESIILLKNDNNILPLKKDIKIAVVGPNADNIYNQLGDYTAPQDIDNVVTVLEGIKSKVKNSNIKYIKGCSIRDTSNSEINEAANIASKSDVIVAVVGGSSARDFKTSYLDTGAAITSTEIISDMESGEGFDRASLNLLGNQLELLNALKNTGKPLIVIYIQGRPLDMDWAAVNADALLTAWYPGQEGGNAIADVLFGDYNPAGRLPISIPRNVGQLPVYYNKKNPKNHDYVEMSEDALYPFGYGLSYSTFEYSDLLIENIGNGTFNVSFNVKNTGIYDGDEVIQLYLRDNYASVVQPIKQLKKFQRIKLKKGETLRQHFVLTPHDFSIIDLNFNKIIEAGEFTIMIGGSSTEIKLNSTIFLED